MKKILALTLSALMIFAMTACGTSDSAAGRGGDEDGADPLSMEEMEPTEGAPVAREGQMINEQPIAPLDIAGSYEGIDGNAASISIYTSPEEDSIEVGNADFTDVDSEVIYTGVICQIADNLYELQSPDGVTFSVYTDGGIICLDMYVNGEHREYFTMIEHYVS